jgi:cytochrome c oxidase assembly protein subunit 15
MPFDERTLPAAERARRDRRAVAAWLFLSAGMILVMIVLGGATRLTGSGLSIMEWAPLSGALPPLSHAEWERLFALYQQIPQYQMVNRGFGLAGFQHIFWLEWTHRLWGRLLGVVFFVPLVWFWATGRLERHLRPRLLLIFVLGGLQGAIGWFMVASGFLPDATSVSPYRLVAHLVMALLLYAAVLWTGLSVLRPRAPPLFSAFPGARAVRRLVAACVGLVSLTIVAGGFTAGNHAGLVFNTFPLMDGRLVPEGYGQLTPWPRNLFENVAAVQFDHRLLATLTALCVLAAVVTGLRTQLPRALRRAMLMLGAAVLMQYGLGVATLLSWVAIPLATAHQAMAVLLLTAALIALHGLRSAPPPHTRSSRLTQTAADARG